MDQATELSRVKARIRALAEKTTSNGCTEAEALAAAEMVGRLLERYALTMEQVDLRETPCVQLEVFAGGQRRRPIDGCVVAIARFCDCKVWLTRGDLGVAYIFFGFETDAMLARYLFEVIGAAIRTEVAAFRQRNPRLRDVRLRRASDSFQHGMAARVAARLTAMHAEREATVAAQRSTGTALIVAKHQLIETAFRATQTRLVSARSLARRVIRTAYQDGLAAGERVNLSRPLTGDGPVLIP
ncbi:MAG: DUF2786 domain-containing protein [Acetobacteraceae bacterium]|nr:DUF2786 domain-containing protein [Acetobacteraceae bacterium]